MMLYTTICIIATCPLRLMLHNLSNGHQSVIPQKLCLNSQKDSLAAVYLLIEGRGQLILAFGNPFFCHSSLSGGNND